MFIFWYLSTEILSEKLGGGRGAGVKMTTTANIPAAKLWDMKNIYMAVFLHGIDFKIMVSENVEWLLVILENN